MKFIVRMEFISTVLKKTKKINGGNMKISEFKKLLENMPKKQIMIIDKSQSKSKWVKELMSKR